MLRKKLIEVSLPLEAINVASAREKSIRHGHPSTLHLWWARRPLAAARAVIFAQMVDDPSAWPDLFLTEKSQEKERQRLFRIIEDLVKWESTTDEAVLQRARDEIWRSWRRACAENVDHPRAKELFDRDKLPAFHDPFAGGGALPLEAQRLCLESYASDLNPVAVLINKAMIEFPPKFAGRPPVNPESLCGMDINTWKGARGLAEDVQFYGQWVCKEAEKRIGHLYPKVEVTAEMTVERPDLKPYVGKELTVIAWLWARTVKSPNPAFRSEDVPLVSTFILSTKAGREAYVEPEIQNATYSFKTKVGRPNNYESAKNGTKLSRGANFQCLLSGSPIGGDYIKAEGQAGRLGVRLMSVVAEGDRGRVYLSPSLVQEAIVSSAHPTWIPDLDLPDDPRNFWTVHYGLTTYASLFTPRQLMALATFSDLVSEAREKVRVDAIAAGMFDDGKGINDGGVGSLAYADAVVTYLSFVVDKCSDYWSSICTWHNSGEKMRNTFGRQAIPMTWDFAEGNPYSDSSGNWMAMVDWCCKALSSVPASSQGFGQQADASTQSISEGKVVSTDPPYYDNIGYADLSDFFYIWLRRSLQQVFPDLFATIAVPKAEELVATPYRHGGKAKAERFFLHGMTDAMHRLSDQSHPAFPVTIYYAFKQSETTDGGGEASTGWETFLEAVIRAGFALSGTWPIRTELSNRMIGSGTNALASSIVLVCHKRVATAKTVTRREFLTALQRELARAVADLQHGNIAPVDLQQAAIGPGMAIFTRYTRVLGADGQSLSVRDALAMINQVLDEVLTEQDGDFDSDTLWALTWFEQFGFAEGEYGIAETLSKAKNTSVQGIVDAGIVASGRGRVRLLRPEELDPSWSPNPDERLTVWETVHHLIRCLETQAEAGSAELLAKLGSKAETARELAYRLYALCTKTKRSQDAQRYNALVQSWPEIIVMAERLPKSAGQAQQTFEGMN